MIKKTALALGLFFGTFFAIDSSFNLMSQPNDILFMAGITLLVITIVLWFNIFLLAVKKLFKENNEKY